MLEKTISEIEYYYKNPNIAPLHYYGASIVQIPKQLIFDTLALLKTREPKPPVTSEAQYGDHLQHCPSCERALPNSGVYGKSYYCYKCGQAVKWE